MSAKDQTEKLANFIMKEFPDKITNGGAGDVAIEILSEYKKITSDNSEYTKCTNEVFKYVTDNIFEDGITKKEIRAILKKHFA